jgi:uncharacterized protein
VKPRYHAIPRGLFNALAVGRGGQEAISALAAAQYSKHVILLQGVLEAAREAGAAQAQWARLGWEVLEEVQRHDQHVAAQVTRYPAVGAWAVRTLVRLGGDGEGPVAEPSRLAAVAAVAAIQSGLEAEIPVPPVNGVVSLPSLGAVQVGGDSATVRSHAGRAEVRWAHGRVEIPSEARPGFPGWLGLRRCQAGRLAPVIDDLDPFRMPAVPGLASRLTDQEAGRWTDTLRRGWQVLETGHADIAAEIASAISVIVPMSESSHGHLSSSSPDSFGAVAMSEPPEPITCASTLVHEVQHLKLGAILDIVKLTLPDDGRRYYAPWRTDPRPIAGLLQGAYAFLGVTDFWRRQRQLAAGPARRRADEEFALWRAGTVRVIETLLSSGRLTLDGADFVRHMAGAARDWTGEPVPAEARSAASREARRHLAQWEASNGPVPA